MISYGWVECRGALYPSGLPDLDYALNPYVGCQHGCVYCYSRSVLGRKDLAERWGSFVWAKRRLLDRLRADLRRKPKGVVGVGTVTDPYQPLEGRLKLTREALKLLEAYGFPASIQTKSPLILRDKDLVARAGFDVGVTITTLDEILAGRLEPGAPPPKARVEALRQLSASGVETWLFYGPIIPEVNDSPEIISQVVKVAVEAGCKTLIYDKLNLKRWVLESLSPVLESLRPGLTSRVRETLAFRGYWARVSRLVEEACEAAGIACEPAFPGPWGHQAPGELLTGEKLK
ncbi:MAG: SPL family radical SAM protein [Candidatus Hecatellaceae archaeon]